MECTVLFTDEFGRWWDGLTMEEQDAVDRMVRLLELRGATLGFPHSSGILSSTYSHMRELRIQYGGEPYRVLYAFDPKRNAVLLVGGVKTGEDRWYEIHVPIADRVYRKYIEDMEGQ